MAQPVQTGNVPAMVQVMALSHKEDADAMVAALKRHGVVKRVIEIKRGGGRRLVTAYALFDAERWAAAADGAWRKHLTDHNPALLL